MSARVISIILGLVFIAVGVLGFVPGQKFVGAEDAIFRVDFMHNVVHLASGLLLLILPSIIGGKQSLLLLGVIYAAVAVLGFLHPTDAFLINGQIAMNDADRYLHVALAAVLLLAGLVFSNRSYEDA
jgi:hypothetical protein